MREGGEPQAVPSCPPPDSMSAVSSVHPPLTQPPGGRQNRAAEYLTLMLPQLPGIALFPEIPLTRALLL